MVKKQQSNVDQWLERETNHIRTALESASKHFDGNDNLTVNTLEAIYGQESSFGYDPMLGKRGSAGAAGHFKIEPDTAKRYGLSVSKKNDQRFDIDYASSAAARYLKDLDNMFSKKTNLGKGLETIPDQYLRTKEIHSWGLQWRRRAHCRCSASCRKSRQKPSVMGRCPTIS